MKHLQLHKLIVACLINLILLVVFLATSTPSGGTSAAISRFNRTLSETVDAGSGSALPPQLPTLETDLPATSIQNAAKLADKLTTWPHLISKQNLADFQNFVSQVSTGQKDMVRGVYVPGIFAFPIIQQPKNNPIFVSNKHDWVTQFQSATRNGVTGLLAHNYLAGSLFYKLVPGHQILVVYGDGAIQRYEVVSIHRYQKLKPSSLYSNLVDLSTGQEVASAEVFRRFYRGEHHLIFQTCLERNGRLDWGFLFVVALPLD